MRFLILLGVCFIVGMLIFGDNPLREFQRQQKELMAKYGGDELTINTNLFVEKQQNQGGGGIFGGGGAAVAPNTEKDMLNSIKSSGNVSVSSDVSSDTAIKVAEPDDTEENYVGVEVNTSASNDANKNKGKISNYYPPIVGETPEVVENQKTPVVFTGREPKLRSGQVIAFEGIYVYLVDQYGNKKPMPDGTYNLQDGSTIVVTNGRNMLRQ